MSIITGTADYQQLFQGLLSDGVILDGKQYRMEVVRLADDSVVNVSSLPSASPPNLMESIALGRVPGFSTVTKFGKNDAIGTSLASVTDSGFYRTPTGTVTLELISDDADDSASGAGAQQVTLTYLDENFDEQTGTLDTNGTSASTGTISGIKRMYRFFVSRSGAYASETVPSQQGTLTLREVGGGQTWASIPEIGTTGFGVGQSLIGAYTVKAGHTAFLLQAVVTVDTTKVADLFFFARRNADDDDPPYSGALRDSNVYVGIKGELLVPHVALVSYPEKTDLLWMAMVGANTASVSVEFELMIVDNNMLS